MDARCRCGTPSCLRTAPSTAVATMTNPPGHLWRDKWTALSGPLSYHVSPGTRSHLSATVLCNQGLPPWCSIPPYTLPPLLPAGAGGAGVPSGNSEHISQSQPDSGLDLSHFQCLKNNLRMAHCLVLPRGRNTRHEDVEVSPTQSRISPSIQRSSKWELGTHKPVTARFWP